MPIINLKRNHQLYRGIIIKDKIIIVNGLDKVDAELRRIGNNINQLTRLANEKIITVVDLKKMRMEVNNILFNLLIQKIIYQHSKFIIQVLD